MISVDLSFQGLAHGNLFNFLVIAVAVGICYKLKLVDILNSAATSVADSLKKSDDEKLESERLLVEVRKEVENLPQELARIEEDAQRTLEAYKKATVVEIEEMAQRMDDNAKKVIDNEIRRVTSALERDLALDAIEVAHQRTIDSLANDYNLHRKFINEAIEKIEGTEIK